MGQSNKNIVKELSKSLAAATKALEKASELGPLSGLEYSTEGFEDLSLREIREALFGALKEARAQAKALEKAKVALEVAAEWLPSADASDEFVAELDALDAEAEAE